MPKQGYEWKLPRSAELVEVIAEHYERGNRNHASSPPLHIINGAANRGSCADHVIGDNNALALHHGVQCVR